MHTYLRALSLSAAVLLASSAVFAAPPPAQKAAPGTLVLVFRDGHRQAFNLADIERVEFPTAEPTGAAAPTAPSRGRFLGKWEVGDGNGGTFYVTLHEDGTAMRTLGDVKGKWVYANGEALITWNDGAEDAIRRVASRYQKFAYKAGKAFTDVPDNVTNARNTTSNPI